MFNICIDNYYVQTMPLGKIMLKFDFTGMTLPIKNWFQKGEGGNCRMLKRLFRYTGKCERKSDLADPTQLAVVEPCP